MGQRYSYMEVNMLPPLSVCVCVCVNKCWGLRSKAPPLCWELKSKNKRRKRNYYIALSHHLLVWFFFFFFSIWVNYKKTPQIRLNDKNSLYNFGNYESEIYYCLTLTLLQC